MSYIPNITVVVLRGGPSSEHEISLNTGRAVLDHLSETASSLNRRIVDVFIDKEGQWHVRGVPVSPESALDNADVVWNALHGTYGEDGTVQALLTRLGVPYTGSRAYASKLGVNKALSKEVANQYRIKTPYSEVLSVSPDLETDIVKAFRSFPQPSVIKPIDKGSSIGVTRANNFHEFAYGIKNAFQHAQRVLLEEYIPGKEATVGVVEGLRGAPLYVLPPTEIKTGESGVFDYDQKYNQVAEELCPGNFTPDERDELKDVTEKMHKGLDLRHYSRSDFRVSPNGIYYLESNTLPGLTQTSLMPKGFSAVGVSFEEFVEHIIKLTLEERRG